LYGLKQAPRTWFSIIECYFQKEGFTRSSHDYALFINKREGKSILVCLYVDDLIYTGNDEDLCAKFKKSMNGEFEMTDLGKMRFFLGVEVSQNADGIQLCQKKYAKEVLDRFQMWNCIVVKNPIVPRTVLSKESEEAINTTLYQQLVGSLMYLTVTRPDIMYVVCLISRYMANPKAEHMQMAKRVLRYLKGTVNFSQLYRRKKCSKVLANIDSDNARDVVDTKSTPGYVFMLNDTTIC